MRAGCEGGRNLSGFSRMRGRRCDGFGVVFDEACRESRRMRVEGEFSVYLGRVGRGRCIGGIFGGCGEQLMGSFHCRVEVEVLYRTTN
jgi:hypothetical protein